MSENPIFSYTKRDYEGSRKEGLSRIPILSEGNWTDLNATDPGVVLLDYVHALVDMINFYQDHQALETFLSTAKERSNIFRIAKQLGYDIKAAKGATCEVTFMSEYIYDHPIKIPIYTKLLTEDEICYITTEEKYLPTGESSVVVPCSQGTPRSFYYTGTGISKLSPVEGAADQVIHIESKRIDTDTILVKDPTGKLWNRVDHIIFSSPEDRVYQVVLNPDNTVDIVFGDGERGRVPREGEDVDVSYIETDAEKGRVPAYAITKLAEDIYDGKEIVEFTVLNYQASLGGSSPQSTADIKAVAPGVIKAQDRAVTLSDFESLALMVEGVASAKAYDVNTRPDLCLVHEVKVLITPTDEGASEDVLKENVRSYLAKRMIPPTNLQILTPSKTPINVSVIVKKVDYELEENTEFAVYEAINNYFGERRGSIGEDFYPSDLAGVLRSLDSVRSVLSVTPNTVVEIQDMSTAVLGEIKIEIQ